VLLVWNRLIFPNGRSIVLERQPGADAEGYAGLEDGVDYHWGELFKAAALSTLLSVGAEAGSSGRKATSCARCATARPTASSQTGQQIVQRQLNIAPTLTIRPGFPSASSSRAISCSNPTEADMAKLKLGPIADDKPVKITVELPASLHRDLTAYAEISAARRDSRHRSGAPDRSHAGAVHGDRSRLCEGEADGFIAGSACLTADRSALAIRLARLSKLRQAGLSLRGNHTAQNGRVSSRLVGRIHPEIEPPW
jgi:hypothetical protein